MRSLTPDAMINRLHNLSLNKPKHMQAETLVVIDTMIGLSSLVEISGSLLCKALDQPITGDIAYDHNINFHATETSVSVKKNG